MTPPVDGDRRPRLPNGAAAPFVVVDSVETILFL